MLTLKQCRKQNSLGNLKNEDGIIADGAELLEKFKETKLKFSQRSVTVKLTNSQLDKLKSAAKNSTGTILRINKKIFQDEEFLHELFLTTTQLK